MKTAVQLYTLRDHLREHLEDGLRRVAEMGYDGVELAGTYGYDPAYIVGLLKEYKLTPISAHVSYSDIFEGKAEIYREMGCEHIVIPHSPTPTEDTYRELIERAAKAEEIIRKTGAKPGYHNHDFEFSHSFEGKVYEDLLLESVPGLDAQFDVCWVNFGGGDPIEYLNRYKGRTPTVHLKDYVKKGEVRHPVYDLIGYEPVAELAGEDEFDQRPFGYGVVDSIGIIDTAKKNGVEWLIVELDKPQKDTTALWCVEESLKFIRKHI
ncbi:MAG: sugar phosphate isomerase/epimerase [Clostridia bacterium]|nr:sugar phosphate isomerase/epimerase [Clostridia bacterium]